MPEGWPLAQPTGPVGFLSLESWQLQVYHWRMTDAAVQAVQVLHALVYVTVCKQGAVPVITCSCCWAGAASCKPSGHRLWLYVGLRWLRSALSASEQRCQHVSNAMTNRDGFVRLKTCILSCDRMECC